MLVLSRDVEQVIHIGDDIRVVVVQVNRDGSVKLGVDAPRDVLCIVMRFTGLSKLVRTACLMSTSTSQKMNCPSNT